MTSEPTTVDLLPGVESPGGVARRRWPLVVGVFLGTLTFAVLLAGIGLTTLTIAYATRVLPGVSIAGLPVGGMDRAQAAALLSQDLPSVSGGVLRLQGPDGSRTVSYRELGRAYDTRAMLSDALGIGRAGDPLQRALLEVQVLTQGASVPAIVTYDSGSVDALVGSVAASVDRAAANASVTLGPQGTFVASPAVPGRSVSVATLKQEIVAVLTTTLPHDATVRVPFSTIQPSISTAAAEAARNTATLATSADLSLAAGDLKVVVPAATLRNWVAFQAAPGGAYQPTFLTSATRSLLESLVARVDRSPRSARFVTDGAKVVGVLSGVNGQELNVDASLGLVNAALLDRAQGTSPGTLDLAVAITPPKLTNAAAQKVAPMMRMISSWTTYYTPYVENYWGKNIEIPTSTLDGYVVMPGAWFDFWKGIGGITAAQGYGPGGAIINGHTELTGALGGGICSCSTTLFNAALRAGLEIGDRTNHYYYISRYPVGLDATVYENGSDVVDMTFRNDTAYPILIRGINGPGSVTFQLYSVPTGRTVTLSTPIIKNRHAATDGIEYTTSLPPGQSKRVEWPADGFDAWVTRTVRDASGAIIHQETFYSHYATVNGLTLVGVAPGDPRLKSQSTGG